MKTDDGRIRVSPYIVYIVHSFSSGSISGITRVHLSFHMSVACMGNCKLSGLLCSIVPEGFRESPNGCKILLRRSRQVPQQHQHFSEAMIPAEAPLTDPDLISAR